MWIILVLLALLSSCSPRVVTVPVREVHTQWRERLQRDSVYVHDSVFLTKETRGDTVYLTRENHHWHYQLRQDTLRLERVDSIPVVREVIVERPRPWLRDLRDVFLWASISVGLALLGGVLWRFVLRR